MDTDVAKAETEKSLQGCSGVPGGIWTTQQQQSFSLSRGYRGCFFPAFCKRSVSRTNEKEIPSTIRTADTEVTFHVLIPYSGFSASFSALPTLK